MMDYGGTGMTQWTDVYADVPTTTGLPYEAWRGSYRRRRPSDSALDSSAFVDTAVTRAPAPALPDSGALPGEVLTAAVAANLEERRVLLSVFRKLASEESIARSTLASLDHFLDVLPRGKRLPTVSPDGEGGLTLAWTIPGQGRTLITLANGVLYVVGNAGTPEATYLPEVELTGPLPDQMLALIPE